MKKRRHILLIAMLFGLLFGLLAADVSVALHIPPVPFARDVSRSKSAVQGVSLTKTNVAATPFMHRPYYGSQTILQRTTSFVDHDQPWYSNDGTFVRYDGAKWTNVAIGSCIGGVNCYDGHNGYDLNLRFEPVLSAAAGTVIRAGWYDPSNHQSSLGLWAAVDHGNGYVTAYGHMSALTVAIGDNIGAQWQVGTSGTTGSSTGPHLHMATYYLPNWNATDPFGWTGNYADPNVVSDNYLWVDNPGTSYTIPDLSGNGSAVYPGATFIDDGTSGWSSTGSWTVDNSSTDIQGSLHWTATTSGSATASATWQPHIAADGYYEVAVFVNDNHASSSWAPYTVYSADPNHAGVEVSHNVYVDESHIGSFQGPYNWQTTGPQWISLGTYYFRASMNGRVVLSNATGENGLQISADGAEFVPISTQTTPPPVYGFTITSNGTPATLLPGSTVNVPMTFKNTGNFTWQASGTGAVQVLYRWLNAQKQVIATGNPLALSQNVNAGSSINVTVPVQVPVQAGSYTLQWDMLQSAKTFSQQGVQVPGNTVNVVPNLPRVYYFAEGYTGSGTSEYLSLTNPSASAATVTVTFLYAAGAPRSRTYIVPAQAHSVLNINQEAGANQAVSMIVQGDQPFVAERTMYTQKGAFVAASDAVGSSVLSSNWYFAEANTTFGWSTLLAVMNPGAQAATLHIAYLLGSRATAAPLGTHRGLYTIPAYSRATIVLNNEQPNAQFGMVITASSPVLIERPEYLMLSNLHGGNSVMGATAPQKTWYFAGGNTSPGFTERLVLANPFVASANVQIHYLTTSGQVLSQNVLVPGFSRIEVNVNDVVQSSLHASVMVSDQPVIAERQDFFSTNINGTIMGSTTSMGSSGTYTSWYMAQGDTTAGHTEYVDLANPNSVQAQVQIVYYLASGAPIIKSYTLAANTRLTVNILGDVGGNRVVGVAIYASVPLAMEQDMFFNVQGATGGYASAGYGV